MPRPAASAPAAKMAKTQPLMTAPAPTVQRPPVALVAPAEQPANLLDAIPLPLCWALLGVSTVTLLIQLWTYFS
jgi:hypothetical protein